MRPNLPEKVFFAECPDLSFSTNPRGNNSDHAKASPTFQHQSLRAGNQFDLRTFNRLILALGDGEYAKKVWSEGLNRGEAWADVRDFSEPRARNE